MLPITCDKGQTVVKCSRRDQDVAVADGLTAANPELTRNLSSLPRDVTREIKHGVMAEAEPAVLLLEAIEALGELTHTDDADVKWNIRVLCQEARSSRMVAFDLALKVDEECRIEKHQPSFQCEGAREGWCWASVRRSRA